MNQRRSNYFIFQGLLTVILLLFFLYQRELVRGWPVYLMGLTVWLGGALVFLAKAPVSWLKRAWVQACLFLGDVLLSSLTLYWAQRPDSDLYLTYFLVIFGTALTQNMVHSFLVALLATLLYAVSAIHSVGEWTLGTEFWLRIPYLWIMAAFTALLTRDTREERQKQEHQYQERLFHMERLAALGQISAEIAHRIKAPLTTIRVNAEVLAHQQDTSRKALKELTQIQQEVDHCKEILQKLLNLGRIEEMDIESMDLAKSIRAALETVRPQLESQRVELREAGLDEPAIVQGDPVLLTEAILAVLQNAVEAMPQGGDLRVSLHWVRRGGWWLIRSKNRDSFEIVIEDTGAGIDPAHLETIFRPFYTTKKEHGNGLGLSAALRILVKHSGSIRATSDGVGRGARFTLTLPKSSSAKIAESNSIASPSRPFRDAA